jgi:hypothetical protein
MFERFVKIRNARELAKPRGTALLVALLVMGILTAVSLAVSSLIIKEIGTTRLALDAGKAYYAAESGIEIALLQLEENLPGYEGALEYEVGVNAEGAFEIGNKTSEYPYIDEDEYDVSGAPANVFYDSLGLNESITIPLFAGDGVDGKVTKFRVYYYVKFSPDDLNVSSFNLSGWDILRWKIYGIKGDETESINDFTSVSVTANKEVTDAGLPTWFGSVRCNGGNLRPDVIECADFDVGSGGDSVEEVDGQSIYTGVCFPWEAEEHYYYEDGRVEAVHHCYSIETFLENHDYNYLTLTNLMNPAVFKATSGDPDKLSRLYFRVEAYEGELVRGAVSVDAVGESGDSKVKLNVMKKRDSYLPVFNFALYHTK